MLSSPFLDRIRALHDAHCKERDRDFPRVIDKRNDLFAALREARDCVFDKVFARIPSRPGIEEAFAETKRYSSQSDWSLLDVTTLAAVADAPVLAAAEPLAVRAAFYQACRMIDDAIDGHATYKDVCLTVLGAYQHRGGSPATALAAGLLPAVAIVLHTGPLLGSAGLSAADRVLAGALYEAVCHRPWTIDSYRQMVEGKMVSYGELLYAPALDLFPEGKGAVAAFLARSFFVGQIVNDLQDHEDDRASGQPNFWLVLAEPGHPEHWVAAEAALSAEISALDAALPDLPSRARLYAHGRIADLLQHLLLVEEPRDPKPV